MPKRQVAFSESDSDTEAEKPVPKKETKRRKTNRKIPIDDNSDVFDRDEHERQTGPVQLSLTESLKRAETTNGKNQSAKKSCIENYFSPKPSKRQEPHETKRKEVSVDSFFGRKSSDESKPITASPKTPQARAKKDVLVPETPELKRPGAADDSFESSPSLNKCSTPTTTKSGPALEQTPSPVPKSRKLSPKKSTSVVTAAQTPPPSKSKMTSPKKSSTPDVTIPPTPPTKSKTTSPNKSTPVASVKEVKVQPSPSPKTSATTTTPNRASFWAYQSREGPRNLGSVSIPKGSPNCLKDKTFLITGVLECIERESAHTLIERCGGKVVKTLGKRTNYLVVGREPGESKLSKAETLKTTQLTEDEFFTLIRELSGESIKVDDNQGDVLVEATKDNVVPKPTSPSKSPAVTSGEAKKKLSPKLTAKPVVVSGGAEETTTSMITKPTRPPSIDPNTNKKTTLPPPTIPRLPPQQHLWVEKYRPASRKTLVGQAGQASPANKLFQWLSDWYRHFDAGTKASAHSSAPPWASSSGDDGKWARAALLSGPPGIGKTTTALVVCDELGLGVYELNASDCRSKKSLQSEVSQAVSAADLSRLAKGQANDLSSRKHVLVMDEVDGMAGNEDRGGMQELIQLIKSSKIPIICTCNDRQSQKVRSLANYCLDLRFQRPRVEQIKAAILSIACKEGVTLPTEVINSIIDSSNHDLRQVINNVQMWCCSGLADSSQLLSDASGARKDLHLNAFDVVRRVFQPTNPDNQSVSINESLDLFFQDYSLVPLFVQENYLKVKPRIVDPDPYKLLDLFADASNQIAFGDLVSKRIRSVGTGSWSLLPVQGIFSVVRPGRLLRGSLPGGPQGTSFPAWFGKNSSQGRLSRLSSELALHMRLATHGGVGQSSSLLLDYGSPLADRLTQPLKEGDIDSVLALMLHYNLQREDLDSLLDLVTWSNRPGRMNGIESKVKAALTRAFKKSASTVPYACQSNSSSSSTKSRAKKSDNLYSDDAVDNDTDGLFSANAPSDDDEDDMPIAPTKSSKPASSSSATSADASSTSKKSRQPRPGGGSKKKKKNSE